MKPCEAGGPGAEEQFSSALPRFKNNLLVCHEPRCFLGSVKNGDVFIFKVTPGEKKLRFAADGGFSG